MPRGVFRSQNASARWLGWVAGVTAFGLAGSTTSFRSIHAADHHSTYNDLWRGLFLREGVDAAYPMPLATEVPDLLGVFRREGVKGIAVHTEPGTTVSEGQGYAMFVAGMQGDVAALKGLAVGWQAAGQGIAGGPACGGCAVSGYERPPLAEVCARAASDVSDGVLCKRVAGAYLPGWKMPFTGVGSMGSATDGDEDAITGLIYLAELTDDDEVALMGRGSKRNVNSRAMNGEWA